MVSRVEIGIKSVFCFVQVPYDDLRYLFGEIMYGGHITDDWDRRLCRTYLEEFIKPEMMEGELYLAPGFLLPGNMDYNGYHQVNAPPATSVSYRNRIEVKEKSMKGSVPGVIFAEMTVGKMASRLFTVTSCTMSQSEIFLNDQVC